MITVRFANPRIGDLFTTLLGCFSGIIFPIGFAYVTNLLGAFGGTVSLLEFLIELCHCIYYK